MTRYIVRRLAQAVPLMLEAAGLGRRLVKELGIECGPPDLTDWQELVATVKRAEGRMPGGTVRSIPSCSAHPASGWMS